jgi:N-acetylneuraminate synthase
MIKAAKESGAGLAKFQLFDAEDDRGKPHFDWVKAHELTFDQAKELFDYGQSIGMEVFFSVFAPKYVEWGEKIGVKRYKIACEFPDRHWVIYLVQETHKPVIISSHATEITFPRQWGDRLLYAPYKYPSVNPDLCHINQFDGLSDHSIGLDISKIALARGAQIIERHVVLKHNPLFPDDAWSSTFEEIAELVKWEGICRSVLQ